MTSSAWRMWVGLFCGLAVLGLGACQDAEAQVVQLVGTSLSAVLPVGWELAPAKLPGLNPTALRFRGGPGLEITMSQNATIPFKVALSLPFECDTPLDSIRGAMEVLQKQNGGASLGIQLLPRPNYIPQEYYSRILMVPGSKGGPDAVAACLYLGNSYINVMMVPAPNPSDGAKLTPMLQSIADSGKKVSTLLYAPDSLRLPMLGVTAAMTSGTWALGTIVLPAPLGQRDLLVRGSGITELKIIPWITDGICSITIKNDAHTHRENPSYVSSEWEPTAGEQLRQNTTAPLQLTVCRQIAPMNMLLVLMFYGSEAVPNSDAPIIARALDDIADAVLKDQSK